MSLRLYALLAGMVLAGCAAREVRTEGVSGPIAWRVVDVDVRTVGEASGMIGRAPQEVYAFTLVLHEAHGTAITFTNLAATISTPFRNLLAASFEQPGRWELPPQGELRFPLETSYSCPSLDCGHPGALAPRWHILLTGTDTRGHPVRVVIDLQLPANPTALEKR